MVKKYYSYRALPTSKKVREKRAKRQNVTTATQAEVNRRLRMENLTRLIMENYEAGAWYITYTYSEKPTDEKAVLAEDAKFKRTLRRIYHRAGMEARYISVLENLKGRGRPHGHILLPALTVDDMERIQKAWKHGRVQVKLYGGGAEDAALMAAYFTKEKIDGSSGRIQTSRNLTRTPVKKERVTRSEAYREEITLPRGYRLIRGLSQRTHTAEGYPVTIAYFERDTRDTRQKRRTRDGE